MSNPMKKHGFSSSIPRLFTRGDHDAYSLIHFQEQEKFGDETSPGLESPHNWGLESSALLAEQTAQTIPAQTKALEENTVPSWLWRHVGIDRGTKTEASAQQIFDRVVGSAAYSAWKQNVFATETEARTFFDEARYALAQRFIAIEPRALATLGLDWAYGLTADTAKPKSIVPAHPIEIPNTTIDAVVSGKRDKAINTKWQKIIAAKNKTQPTTLRFPDIASDWNAAPTPTFPVMLDLMAFRHNDGAVNIDALRHATKLAVILLDLHEGQISSWALGFCNLAPLLTALAIPYDSDGARAMAAAIGAIITAEAYATSAQLAGLRGPSADYNNHRELILRSLRNHRRAAYGDRNDYEKVSVLPVPLKLEQCPDLALVATAQRCWTETLELVRQNGLRHIQMTALSASPALTLFMESTTQGIEPLRTLITTRAIDNDVFEREESPFVAEALSSLRYNSAQAKAIGAYISGHKTLTKAPAINHTSLHALGFDETTIAQVENYIPNVDDIRFVFTQWILGEDFCRKVLKIPATKLKSPRLDILEQLGFSASDIAAANTFCYGHDSVKGSRELRPQHTNIFAKASDITAEAKIRMAASLQSFISGEIELSLSLSPATSAEKNEKLLLSAWRQGLKSLTLAYDATGQVAQEKQGKASMTAFLHTKRPSLPARKPKMAARRNLVSMKSHGTKTAPKSRNK